MRILLFIVLLLISSLRTEAAEMQLLFWYPGEAGTAAQAQPLLDQFAALLARHTPGTTWSMHYLRNEQTGLQQIRKRRPQFGIVSYAMYWKHRAALAMTPTAQTRPLPSGNTEEPWVMIPGFCKEAPTRKAIFSSQPFAPALLQSMFGTEKITKDLDITSNMLKTLQEMANGSCQDAVLSPAEYRSLKALKAEWATSLIVTATAVLPTPPVVRFGTQPSADAVQKALLSISQDPNARPILTELRLKGFAPATPDVPPR